MFSKIIHHGITRLFKTDHYVTSHLSAPSAEARAATFCPTSIPSFKPSLTSSCVWMPASNVEMPASLAMDVNNSASSGNKADMMAADAPEAQSCPDGYPGC